MEKIVKKFITAHSVDKLNAHFRECECANRPYIAIRPGRKYASVEIDLIGQTFDLTNAAVAQIEERFQSLWARKRRNSWCAFGPTYSVVDVPIVDAEPLAEWLYDLACIPTNRFEGDERYGRRSERSGSA